MAENNAGSPPSGSLSNRSILIIGGSDGIGRACAQSCLEHGAEVCVTSHDQASLAAMAAECSGRVVTVHADARAPHSTEDAIAAMVERTGRIDGLVHVAGGSGRTFGDGPLHEITDSGWQQTLELNLTAAFRSNRAAVRQFLAQGGGGGIVNIGSVLAFSPSPRFFATHAYAAAKAGLEGLTRSVAARYARDNVRVNIIASGLADTPMAKRAMSDAGIMGFVASKQPLDGGRAARPADYGEAVTFLLSDAARFITGQSLGIDGGWSLTDGQYPQVDAAQAGNG